MKWQQHIELDGYINLWEVIPEDKHSKLANLIWEALDDEGITLTQDAELSIRVYDSYNSVTHIKGMSEHDSELILSQIRKDLEKYSWDYWWENDNDLILFDNTILQHRRLGDTTDRMAYRYAHDLDEVGGEYIPYFQEEYIERYKKRKAILDEL